MSRQKKGIRKIFVRKERKDKKTPSHNHYYRLRDGPGTKWKLLEFRIRTIKESCLYPSSSQRAIYYRHRTVTEAAENPLSKWCRRHLSYPYSVLGFFPCSLWMMSGCLHYYGRWASRLHRSSVLANTQTIASDRLTYFVFRAISFFLCVVRFREGEGV